MSTPKRRRSPKRSDVLKTPKNSAIDGEPHVNPNETAGIINQFEVLPEPDREFVSCEIRRTLEKAIRALSNFRLSEKGPALSWPGERICNELVCQIRSFRTITDRSQRGPNFRVLRAMDNRWRRFELGRRIQMFVDVVQRYLDDSVFAALRIELRGIKTATPNRKVELIRTKQLILKRRTAAQGDLALLLPWWPKALQGLRQNVTALQAQEILHLVYSAEVAKRLRARPAIDLINIIGTPKQKLQVSGLNQDQVEELRLGKQRAANAARGRRCRAKKKKTNSLN